MPMGQKKIMETISQAIAQLTATQRHVLQRVDLEGYTYSEVAVELQIPMCTVKSHLYRARAQVRDQLVIAGLVPGVPIA